MSALIDPQELHQKLNDGETIKLIDATYPPNPAAPVIGDARAFDIDAIANLNSPLPHTLPSAETFEAAIGAMGIGNNDEVVIYDQSGMAMAAARVWWMFRVFGHVNVKLLNAGLPLWHAMGLPLNHTLQDKPETAIYKATFNPALFADRDYILAHHDKPDVIIADARPSERFAGTTADLRPGMPSGHIPGSTNVPFMSLLDPATGMLIKNDQRIKAIIAEKPARIIASCGSGVTAGIIALALYEAGKEDVAIYGGSWAEWGHPSLGMPTETGDGKKF